MKTYVTFIRSNELLNNNTFGNEIKIIISEDLSRSWTNNSPQNAGVNQALIRYSYNGYAHTKHVTGKEAILDLIDRNDDLLKYLRIFKVKEVDYNVHKVTKERLKQIGRCSKWDWVSVENVEELLSIFSHNESKLK